MKVQILQQDLSKSVNTAIHFIASRVTLPILSNFMLEADKTKLKIMGTNLEMSITSQIGAKVEEEGALTVNGKLFLDLITNLEKNQLTLESVKEELKILANNFSGNLPITPSNDFPKIPDTIDLDKSFKLNVKEIKKTLSKILFATSADMTRPVLGGVLFVFEGDTLTLVASDGFRLSKKQIKLNSKITNKNIIIPKNSLLELIKIAENEEFVDCESKENENQLVIKIGETYLTTRLIDGNFPSYEKIIPSSSLTAVSVDKNDLIRAVKLASVFAKDAANVIKFKINENSLEVVSEGKLGNQKGSVEEKVVGPVVEISFNYKFIEDFLNNAEAETVDIKLTDSMTAAIFIDPNDPDFLHLIMPVRVQS